jgi:hypothetical protein
MSRWSVARETMFGEPYMVWHDGPDFTQLRDEWKRDPEGLIELLFEGMAEDDALASQSFSELDPPPTDDVLAKVLEKLESQLASAGPYATTQIARTLFKLSGDGKWELPVIEVLDSALHWSSRIDAAMALRDFPPTDAGRAALLRNVQTDDYLVRYHSASTLLKWAGVTTAIEDDDALFTLLVKDANPAAWKQVADALAKLG